MQNPSRTILLLELRILRIEVAFRLSLGVEVIQIAEELVESVLRRQMPVPITQMILAELTRRIPLRLQHIRYGRHPIRDAVRISRHADGEQSGTERLLTQNERSAAGGAALLPIGVCEE